MNTNKNKDINELLGKFFPADEAARVADDIRRGDELLSKNPAPLPRAALLAKIKTQTLIAHHRKQRAHRQHYIYGSMAMAASVMIICGLAWIFLIGGGSGIIDIKPFTDATWKPVTEDIATITTQLNQIENTAIAIKAVDFDAAPAEYQADVAAFETSLWKG
jgi:hypothetical protein